MRALVTLPKENHNVSKATPSSRGHSEGYKNQVLYPSIQSVRGKAWAGEQIYSLSTSHFTAIATSKDLAFIITRYFLKNGDC